MNSHSRKDNLTKSRDLSSSNISKSRDLSSSNIRNLKGNQKVIGSAEKKKKK